MSSNIIVLLGIDSLTMLIMVLLKCTDHFIAWFIRRSLFQPEESNGVLIRLLIVWL